MHTLNIIVLNTNVEATYSHYCDLWSHLISIPIIIILTFPFQVPVPVFLYISRIANQKYDSYKCFISKIV